MSMYADENDFMFNLCAPQAEEDFASSSRRALDDITNLWNGPPTEQDSDWTPLFNALDFEFTAAALGPEAGRAIPFTDSTSLFGEETEPVQPSQVHFTAAGKRKRESPDECEYSDDDGHEQSDDEDDPSDDDADRSEDEENELEDEENETADVYRDPSGGDDASADEDDAVGEKDTPDADGASSSADTVEDASADEDDADANEWVVEQPGTGLRFTCPWESCRRSFRRKADRNRHVNSHTRAAPELVCQVCKAKFSSARKDSLHRHQLEMKGCIKKQKTFTDDQLRAMNCVTSAERAMSKARAKSRKTSQRSKTKSQTKSRKA